MSSEAIQGGTKKRRQNRGYRSYPVKYGRDIPEHEAYARRLSEAGLFIATNRIVYPVGSSIIMDIDIGGTVYHVAGRVRNALKIEARYVRLFKPGMGIEFIEARPDLKQALTAGGH